MNYIICKFQKLPFMVIIMWLAIGVNGHLQAGQYFEVSCSAASGSWSGCILSGCSKHWRIWADNPYEAQSQGENAWMNHVIERKGWSIEKARDQVECRAN